MKTVIKEITIYELDEIKEKAIEENRDINTLSGYWCDNIIKDWEEKLESLGFTCLDIHFDISYCQGSGASFTAEYCDIPQLVSNLYPNEPEKVESIQKWANSHELAIKIERINTFYVHENTCEIRISFSEIDRNPPSHIFSFFDDLEIYRKKLCIELRDELWKELDYLKSDEVVYETLKANEYLFNENGTIYKE